MTTAADFLADLTLLEEGITGPLCAVTSGDGLDREPMASALQVLRYCGRAAMSHAEAGPSPNNARPALAGTTKNASAAERSTAHYAAIVAGWLTPLTGGVPRLPDSMNVLSCSSERAATSCTTPHRNPQRSGPFSKSPPPTLKTSP